ncbi:MAG: V-type ATP synthase subunit A [Brevinemataceae bacterium]
MKSVGIITRINGPLISIKVTDSLQLMEMVHVSELQLVGEVLSIDDDTAVIQVYETTDGVKLGEPVYGTGMPLSVELGPGLISQMFDGIQRPLSKIAEQSQSIYLERGLLIPALDRSIKWEFTPTVFKGTVLEKGAVIGTVPETPLVTHYVMIPPNLEGIVKSIVDAGSYTVEDVIGTLEDSKGVVHELKLAHRWPVKVARPYKERFLPNQPLLTGQRIIDIFFPVAKGGAVAIPGGFGTGKTITQHQLAKWSDAKIVVYVGCGERGNEITEVLEEFPHLIDPHTGLSLFDRTVMIANTSNMPVTAREASIYTGITIAEYYRDMGYDIAVMADSSSRWAEALRELSGRLEEIPAEEGFPAYLGSKLASFYERAGRVQLYNGNTGSVTMIAAVSPPGGDFSEPVTQNTKRFVRAFWELDKALASARHYPSINWIQSYSEYVSYTSKWWDENIDPETSELRQKAYNLLLRENKLQKIVRLIGPDALPDHERLVLETVRIIKDGFLKQNAYDDIDMYTSPQKQVRILKLIIKFYTRADHILSLGAPVFEIRALESVAMILRSRIEIANDDVDQFNKLESFIDDELTALESKYKQISQQSAGVE